SKLRCREIHNETVADDHSSNNAASVPRHVSCRNSVGRWLRRRPEVQNSHCSHAAGLQGTRKLEDRPTQRPKTGWKLVGDFQRPPTRRSRAASECLESKPQGSR